MEKHPGMPEEMGTKYNERYPNVKPHITADELKELCENDKQIERLVDDMLDYASRYVTDVWEMESLLRRKNEFDTTEWQEVYAKADRDRSQLHDTFIDSIAILSRNMSQRDIDNSWIRELAPTGTLDRARCGKFAIMLMYDQYIKYKLSSGESYDA